MIGFRGLARTLLAGTFVFGGLSAWKRSRQLAEKAGDVTAPVASLLGGAVTTEQLVKLNAGVQVVGGALFAIGVVPRVTGLVLAGSLVPTTLAGHDFWNMDDDAARATHKIQVLKNASILGGLLFVALDTGGRPSIFWTGRKTAQAAADTLATVSQSISETVRD